MITTYTDTIAVWHHSEAKQYIPQPKPFKFRLIMRRRKSSTVSTKTEPRPFFKQA